jgi:peptidoglycan-associated lipoprotein
MNTSFKKTSYPFVLLASLPLLVLGGCASQDTSKAMQESASSIPVADTQDPIAMHNNPVIELTTGKAVSNTVQTKDEHSAVSSSEEAMLFPPATRPQEQRIGFGFDQSEVNIQYQELLKQHAQYLVENKDMILKISGHTDSYGPKEHNKYLSKQRADAVARLLVEYGAPKDRIMVEGVADDEPLLSANRQSENRRVELDYQDQRLVSVE